MGLKPTKRFIKSITLVLLASVSSYAQSNYKNFQIQKITDGVFAAIHLNGGHAICNAGIVDLGDATLIFDCFMTPDAANELKAAAKKLTGKEVRYVVNSHYHNDHIRGNQAFDGCDIIASSKTRELMLERAPEELRSDIAEAPGRLADLKNKSIDNLHEHPKKEHEGMLGYYEGIVQSLDVIRLTYPNITFKSTMELLGTQRTAVLIDMGEGHTPSDVVMWLPTEKILFAGDLLFIQSQPWISDGHPQNWLSILKKIADMQPETIVPGHGPIGDVASIAPLESYIRTVIAEAEKLCAADDKAAAIKRIKCPPPYDHWMLSGFYLPNVTMLSDKMANIKSKTH